MKKIIFLSILLSTFSAFADGDPTEFLYQAKSGETYLQGNFSNLTNTQDFEAGGEAEFKDMDLSVIYETGLSDSTSFYGSIGYGQGETQGTITPTEFNGLNPINLGLKYRRAAGVGQFYAQGNLEVGSLQKFDENRTDGSFNVSARLAYIMSYVSSSAGFVFDLGLMSTDGKDKANSDEIPKSKGFALSAFYEMLFSETVIGSSLTYSADSGVAGLSNNSPMGGLFTFKDASEASILDLKIYTRIPAGEKIHLLGGINYGMILDQVDTQFDGGNNFGINLGVRYKM